MFRRCRSGCRVVITLLVMLGMVFTGSPAGGRTLAAADAVYIIPVEGDIDLGLVSFLARGLEKAAAGGARAVVLKLTPSVDGSMRLPK